MSKISNSLVNNLKTSENSTYYTENKSPFHDVTKVCNNVSYLIETELIVSPLADCHQPAKIISMAGPAKWNELLTTLRQIPIGHSIFFYNP